LCSFHGANKVSGTIKYFTSVWDEQEALLFTTLPLLRINVAVVGIAQIDTSAAFFGDAGRQCYLNAGRFNMAGGIIGASSFDMCAMGENAAWDVFETLPLLEKVVAYMVADLIDELAVGVGYLGNMRRVDDDFTTVGNSWLGLVHGFGGSPEVIIDR